MTATDFDRDHLWHFRAYPLRIIDGDTAVLLCDTGFGGRHEVHIRLAGVWAPERGEPGANEATVKLADALFGEAYHPGEAGWNLRVVTQQRETVVEETRSFERYVATVYAVGRKGEMVDVKERL